MTIMHGEFLLIHTTGNFALYELNIAKLSSSAKGVKLTFTNRTLQFIGYHSLFLLYGSRVPVSGEF
jgi:hypothetical protein